MRRPISHEALAQYYASVTMIDEGVGRALDELEAQSQREKTLIVYTSDHGLNMGHHGLWGKGNGSEPLNMLDESLRVPLIIDQPGVVEGGVKRDEFVTHCDLHLTLLDFAGITAGDSEDSPGRSLKPQLVGDAAGDWRNVYFGEYGTTRAVRDERYKLVLPYAEGEPLLIDLQRRSARDAESLRRPSLSRDPRRHVRLQLTDFFAPLRGCRRTAALRGDDLPSHNRREAWRKKES